MINQDDEILDTTRSLGSLSESASNSSAKKLRSGLKDKPDLSSLRNTRNNFYELAKHHKFVGNLYEEKENENEFTPNDFDDDAVIKTDEMLPAIRQNVIDVSDFESDDLVQKESQPNDDITDVEKVPSNSYNGNQAASDSFEFKRFSSTESHILNENADDEEILAESDNLAQVSDTEVITYSGDDVEFSDDMPSIRDMFDSSNESVTMTLERFEEQYSSIVENLELSKKKGERDSEVVTSEMTSCVKELLKLFGIPYIDAPAEAEAQCAFLNREGLVDGVISNDSDVFLFGATKVYRNVFDQKRYVEKYDSLSLLNCLGLNRERMIIMAILLGSDYTEGINGIGIVNALEILSAFPNGMEGLEEFRDWIFLSSSTDCKRPVKTADTVESEYIKAMFKYNHRNIKSQWQIPEGFPSQVVLSSYMDPDVDKSKEPFSWGQIDVTGIQSFCKSKLGWSDEETLKRLEPLKQKSKAVSGKLTQTKLHQYFSSTSSAANVESNMATIKSTRLKKAISQLLSLKAN
jgi:DNA excision repair protein ERCC-5